MDDGEFVYFDAHEMIRLTRNIDDGVLEISFEEDNAINVEYKRRYSDGNVIHIEYLQAPMIVYDD